MVRAEIQHKLGKVAGGLRFREPWRFRVGQVLGVAHVREDLGADQLPTASTPQVERALRSLLYLVLSAPEYQLA